MSSEPKMTFGDYLRRLREAHGWTQPEAAAKADIEQSYLSKLETGRSYPSEDVYSRLARLYSIDNEELAGAVAATEIESLREIKQVRDAVLAQEGRSLSIARGWMIAGLAFLMLGGGCLGLSVTTNDTEYVLYHYRSDGVLRVDESLDAFEIVREALPLDEAELRTIQSAMVARLDEDLRVGRDFSGRSYVEDVEGGRRFYQLIDDRHVSERSPLRWFTVPGLMLLLGSIGAFFISFRWKR